MMDNQYILDSLLRTHRADRLVWESHGPRSVYHGCPEAIWYSAQVNGILVQVMQAYSQWPWSRMTYRVVFVKPNRTNQPADGWKIMREDRCFKALYDEVAEWTKSGIRRSERGTPYLRAQDPQRGPAMSDDAPARNTPSEFRLRLGIIHPWSL